MGDLQGLSRTPGFNRSTEQGIVVFTGELDQDYLSSIQGELNPFYPTLTHAEKMGVYEDDLCFSFCDAPMKMYPPVFSCFNGGFGDCSDVWDIVDKLRFVGIARGESNWRNQGPQAFRADVALRIGGLFSMPDTSNVNYEPGTWLVWTLPEKFEKGTDWPRQSGRITAYLVPYNPIMDDLTKKYMNQFIRTNLKNPINPESINASPNTREQGAKKLLHSLKTLMYFGIVAGMAAGIIDPNRLEFLKPQRVANRNTFMTKSNAIKNQLLKLAMSLNLVKTDSTLITANDTKINITKDGQVGAYSTDELFLSTLYPTEKSDFVFQKNVNGTLPGGREGELLKLQIEMIENVFGAVNVINFKQKNRIVGKAMSHGKPGFDFEFLMGSGYMTMAN
jgi:hypothetical protein